VSTAGVSGLLVISMIALAAPVLAAGVQRARVPDVVIEIVAGIVVGPSVLGWVKIDQPVGLVALLGLAFLLFLAGLEVDLKVITPSRLRAPLAGYAASLLLGSAAGFAFHAVGWVRSPLFLAITLSSSSLGLVVPVLADALQSRTLLGQLTIAGATLGEFGAITLLSLFFSATRAGTASNAITFGIFGVAAAAIRLTLSRADRSLRLDAFLTRLQDTTAEIRVRIAVALLVGFVALAAKIGLQIILGAFLAGVILNIVDRDTASHPLFRTKFDALGYGFLIPVFFVSSGVEFDLTALTHSPSALAKIPLFLLALLAIRGAPAAFYVRTVGRRGAVAAGLLQATSLPVIVTAASIGVAIRAISSVTAWALVAAGLLLPPPADHQPRDDHRHDRRHVQHLTGHERRIRGDQREHGFHDRIGDPAGVTVLPIPAGGRPCGRSFRRRAGPAAGHQRPGRPARRCARRWPGRSPRPCAVPAGLSRPCRICRRWSGSDGRPSGRGARCRRRLPRRPAGGQREQGDQAMPGRRAEPGDQQRAEFVAVQGDGAGLVVRPRLADVRGREWSRSSSSTAYLQNPAMA